MFTLYEAVPQTVNAFHYSYDTSANTAVEALTNSGLFTKVTEADGVITLSRNGSDYKLKRGTVVVLQDSDNFSLVDDVTFFTQYAELITVGASEFENLVKRVETLEGALKTPRKAPTKKVEKELDSPATPK